MERLRDLTKSDPKKTQNLRVRQLPNGQTFVHGLHEEYVESLIDVLEKVAIANANRTTSSTLMNHSSSRSHSLMMLTVQQKV